jgi:hypothetical protein
MIHPLLPKTQVYSFKLFNVFLPGTEVVKFSGENKDNTLNYISNSVLTKNVQHLFWHMYGIAQGG